MDIFSLIAKFSSLEGIARLSQVRAVWAFGVQEEKNQTHLLVNRCARDFRDTYMKTNVFGLNFCGPK